MISALIFLASAVAFSLIVFALICGDELTKWAENRKAQREHDAHIKDIRERQKAKDSACGSHHLLHVASGLRESETCFVCQGWTEAGK